MNLEFGPIFYSHFDGSSNSRSREEILAERDRQRENDLNWLLGLAESGMSMFIAIMTERETGRQRVSPAITISSFNRKVVDFLEQRFYTERLLPERPRNLKNGRWYLSGKAAVELAQEISAITISRHEIIEAFSNWEQADSLEDQIQIATESRGEDRFANHTPEEYQSLVLNPSFVAGVIDGRGYVADKKRLRLEVTSKNIALLEALQHQYHGVVRPKNGSFHWSIHNEEDIRKILRLVSPFLKISLPEKWQETPLPLPLQQRNSEREQMVVLVQEEFNRYEEAKKHGKLFRFSTAAQLGEQMGITELQAEQRLSALPDGMRKKREMAIRRENNRDVSQEVVGLIVQAILQEVANYRTAKKNGEEASVRTNPELAQAFGIPIYQITRLVTPLLSEEVRRVRQEGIYEKRDAKRRRKSNDKI
jgi:hypothetical protein